MVWTTVYHWDSIFSTPSLQWHVWLEQPGLRLEEAKKTDLDTSSNIDPFEFSSSSSDINQSMHQTAFLYVTVIASPSWLLPLPRKYSVFLQSQAGFHTEGGRGGISSSQQKIVHAEAPKLPVKHGCSQRQTQLSTDAQVPQLCPSYLGKLCEFFFPWWAFRY